MSGSLKRVHGAENRTRGASIQPEWFKGSGGFTFIVRNAAQKRRSFIEKCPIRARNDARHRFFSAFSPIIWGMSATNLIKNRADLAKKISELDRVIHEIAVSGTSSASISAGAGSKSYTRLDLDKLEALRSKYAERYSAICRALRAGSSPAGIRHVMTVRV